MRLLPALGSLLLLPLLSACVSVPGETTNLAYVSSGVSVLPNVGFYAGFGGPLETEGGVEVGGEARFHWQPWDDEDFADDGNASAKDFYQIDLAITYRRYPTERHHWTFRGGFVWFDAQGEPNIIDEEGDSWGLIMGVGFETSLTDSLSIGPEVALLPAYDFDESDFTLLPQFTWGLRWRP